MYKLEYFETHGKPGKSKMAYLLFEIVTENSF